MMIFIEIIAITSARLSGAEETVIIQYKRILMAQKLWVLGIIICFTVLLLFIMYSITSQTIEISLREYETFFLSFDKCIIMLGVTKRSKLRVS